MADEPTDELLLDDPIEDEPQPLSHDEDDGFEVELDGVEPHQETENMRRLREHAAALAKDNADLRKRVAPVTAAEVGKKPDLWEDCEGDPDKFESALLAWNNRKREVEQHQTSQREAQETANRTFLAAKVAFDERAKRVKGVDMAVAERTVADALSPQWVGAIIESSPVAERVIAVLHKYPDQLQAIANEPQDWKKMRMLWDLESKVKTNMAKTPPPPPESETIQRGSSPVAGSGMTQAKFTKRLEELEAEASKNGGRRTKIREFKNLYKGKFA